VAVARRIINNRTYFFYADDMGSPAHERKVKDLLSTAQTDSIFNPQDSIWVSCNNICYRPHSNECGPRSLLALAVMLTHPNPCQNMLIPYMHQNITQEARLWVASLILQGKIDINTHHPPVTQNIRWSSLSIPYSFIEWNDSLNSNIQHPTTNSLQDRNVDGSSPTNTSDSSSREDSIVPGTPSSRTQPKNQPITPQKM